MSYIAFTQVKKYILRKIRLPPEQNYFPTLCLGAGILWYPRVSFHTFVGTPAGLVAFLGASDGLAAAGAGGGMIGNMVPDDVIARLTVIEDLTDMLHVANRVYI